MQSNIGTLDQSIRITLALTVLAIYCIEIVDATTNWLFIMIAFILFFSAVIRHCPLYTFWEYSTKEKEEHE